MRLSIRSSIPWALFAVVAVMLCGCAASGSSSPASSSDTTTAESNSPDQTSSSTQGASTTAASRRSAPGPLRTVQLYWRDIGAQNYRAAYRFLASGSVTQTAADFVSAERQAQIQSVSFQGSLASASTSAATVDVNSLITTDGQYGCRKWSGAYHLTRRAGTWVIAHASIAPASCASTSTNSGAGTGTGGNTGNTGTAGSSACSPLTDSGNCYEPGEYCRDSDHGISGVAGDGETITWEDNNGWRWEPS
jgi:hypothetical protein